MVAPISRLTEKLERSWAYYLEAMKLNSGVAVVHLQTQLDELWVHARDMSQAERDLLALIDVLSKSQRQWRYLSAERKALIGELLVRLMSVEQVTAEELTEYRTRVSRSGTDLLTPFKGPQRLMVTSEWLPGGALGNNPQFTHGDTYIVAVAYHEPMRDVQWRLETIRVQADNEVAQLYYETTGDPFDEWESVEWYMSTTSLHLPFLPENLISESLSDGRIGD